MKEVEHLCIVYYLVSIVKAIWAIQNVHKQYLAFNWWMSIENTDYGTMEHLSSPPVGFVLLYL